MQHTILAQATSVTSGLSVAGNQAGYNSNLPLTTLIANVIQVILGLTGMACVILLVYAGILYLTAQGEDANVKKAKKLISGTIIGILIIVAAWALTRYVFTALVGITT